MRTIRIYQPGDYLSGQTIALSPSASLHVGVVLRMQPGEDITLFPGDNREFAARITQVTKKSVQVQLGAVSMINRESPRTIHLAQAISKGERMEFVIQKAVELGVASITPLFTAHCVVRLDAERLAKKQAQWHAIAIAACEQSGRNTLPIIHPACSFDTYLQRDQAPIKWVLHPVSEQSLRNYRLLDGDMALLIGPEGGLSEAEVGAAIAARFQPLRLGPRVLRTETAAIAALSVLQALGGDL